MCNKLAKKCDREKSPIHNNDRTMLPRNKCNKRYVRVFMKLQNLLKNVIEDLIK